ncbi:hypothetical protein [Flavobacterium bizetiae]|uniref:hypothetical protein n=1 Tax=Flavobacterium bizetiae TaxID=2704140 RepID=UPI003756910B
MQGIDKREHLNLLDAFQKYENMSLIIATAECEEDTKIRTDIAELTVLYNNFKLLLAELERCTRDYESKKRATRSILHKNLRKLHTENKRIAT